MILFLTVKINKILISTLPSSEPQKFVRFLLIFLFGFFRPQEVPYHQSDYDVIVFIGYLYIYIHEAGWKKLKKKFEKFRK